MLNQVTHPPHVRALADKLVADIRRRSLGVGDRYLTTQEASQMLGVRKAVAGMAMRHLAEKEILLFRPRVRALIGPGLEHRKESKVKTVYVLLPAGDPSATHWSYQPFTAGIRSEFSEVNVQFSFVPDDDPLSFVRELILGSRTLGQFSGAIAVSCPPEALRHLTELRVPAVVWGSVYSADLPITAVDSDHRECGRLLTQYVVDRGHRRLAALMTGAGRPGVNRFLDGIIDVLTSSGLAPNALKLCLVPNDLDALRGMAKELLDGPDRPTAVITRGAIQVDALISVAAELGLTVPEDLEIAFDHAGQVISHVEARSYPRVEPKLSLSEIAAMIARLLKEMMSEGVPSQPRRVVIPVEFHIGEQAASDQPS